jgi:hypothetical protein
MDPTLSIIIVNWNTGRLLTDCIQSIQDTYLSEQSSQTEILVIDNGSTDHSLAQAVDCFPGIRVIPNQLNLGFGPANNLAAQSAHGEYLLLLNPDTIVQPGAIHALLDYLQSHPKIGLVGPKLINPDGTFQLSIFRAPTLSREAWRLFHLDRIYPYNAYPVDVLASQEPQPVDILQGTCLFMPRELFLLVGMFDEQFFMYSEEVDLCTRIRSTGWPIHWVPQAKVMHLAGQSTRLVADKMFLMLYRNKVAYFRKHYGQPRTGFYKLLLYVVSISRYLPGLILKRLAARKPTTRWDTSRQYGLMLKEISTF